MTIHRTLYHRDTKGLIRVWWVVQEGNCYCTVAGLEAGEKVTSQWTSVLGKNPGKKNATTDTEQCIKEIDALYVHKLTRKYSSSVESIEDNTVDFPMLAATYDPDKFKWQPPGHITCMAQPKLDGIRCIAKLVDGKVTLWSRQGREHKGFEHIKEGLAMSGAFHVFPDLRLDGEFYNHQLRSEFNTIVSAVRGGHEDLQDLIEYHIYDCFGGELTATAFHDRSAWLKANVKDGWKGTHFQGPIRLVPTLNVGSKLTLDSLYETYLYQGYEGMIIRDLWAPYQVGKRSKALLKRKDWNEAEFPVLDIQEGSGNWAGKARRAILKTGPTVGCLTVSSEADIVGTYEYCTELWAKWQAGWRPKEATVTHFGPISPTGGLRFGKVRSFWANERDL